MVETDQKREPVGEAASFPVRTRESADQDFGEAFIHSTRSHRVLGMRLLPFSFWHAALLDYAESPFAGYAGKIDIAALYIAVRICQMRYPHRPDVGTAAVSRFFAYLRKLYLARKYNDASRIVSVKGPRGSRLSRAVSPFFRELNKFSVYIRDYHSRPTYVPVRDGKPIHVPWYFYEVCLLRRFDPALTEAWDAPVGEGSWKNIGMLEAHGNEVPIMTPAERIASQKTRQVRKPSAKLLARIAEVESMRTRVRYRV